MFSSNKNIRNSGLSRLGLQFILNLWTSSSHCVQFHSREIDTGLLKRLFELNTEGTGGLGKDHNVIFGHPLSDSRRYVLTRIDHRCHFASWTRQDLTAEQARRKQVSKGLSYQPTVEWLFSLLEKAKLRSSSCCTIGDHDVTMTTLTLPQLT